MGRFDGKAVVVTGAGHGIGRASAMRFASEGASVAIVDIRAEEAQLVAEECASAGSPHGPTRRTSPIPSRSKRWWPDRQGP